MSCPKCGNEMYVFEPFIGKRKCLNRSCMYVEGEILTNKRNNVSLDFVKKKLHEDFEKMQQEIERVNNIEMKLNEEIYEEDEKIIYKDRYFDSENDKWVIKKEGVWLYEL